MAGQTTQSPQYYIGTPHTDKNTTHSHTMTGRREKGEERYLSRVIPHQLLRKRCCRVLGIDQNPFAICRVNAAVDARWATLRPCRPDEPVDVAQPCHSLRTRIMLTVYVLVGAESLTRLLTLPDPSRPALQPSEAHP